MQKRDSPSADPAPGGLIHQLVAGGATAGQCGVEIRHAVAHVMNAGSPFGKEFRHGTGRIVRFEQLDGDVTEVQADDLRAIGGFGAAGNKTEDLAIKTQCLGDARYGDADMGDSRVHRTSN